MDEVAKSLLRETLATGQALPNQPLGGEVVTTTFQGLTLARVDRKTLYYHIYGPIAKAYICDRHDVPADLRNAIHWKCLGKALRQEPLGQRRWYCKHISGQLGVGRQLQHRQWQQHDNCPCCDASDEDTTHVLMCPSLSARNQWNKSILKLDQWMYEQKTDCYLCMAITQ